MPNFLHMSLNTDDAEERVPFWSLASTATIIIEMCTDFKVNNLSSSKNIDQFWTSYIPGVVVPLGQHREPKGETQGQLFL